MDAIRIIQDRINTMGELAQQQDEFSKYETETELKVLKAILREIIEKTEQPEPTETQKIIEYIKAKIKSLKSNALYPAFCMNGQVEAYEDILKIMETKNENNQD